MKKYFKRITNGFSAGLLAVVVVIPAFAADIEIYEKTNLGTSTVRPNLMFILDTSGSMENNTIANTDAAYDPDGTYNGADGTACFDESRMYPSFTSDIKCTAKFKEVSYALTQNECDAASTAFAKTGIYSSAYAQWNPDALSWGSLHNTTDDTHYIDCISDQGKHGRQNVPKDYIDITGSGNAYTNDATNQASSWGGIDKNSVTMYTGKWMNYKATTGLRATISPTRMQVMKDAIEVVATSLDDVNMGMMRFSGEEGGYVTTVVQNVTDGRNSMLSTMKGWTGSGYTPLSETLYESYLYFSGGAVDYGSGRSLGGSFDENSRYFSPVDRKLGDCQKQFIIYLSDGAPSRDKSATSKIEGLPGFTNPAGTSNSCTPSTATNGHGECLDDLAGYMNKHGFDAYVNKQEIGNPPPVIIEDVKVHTYTIGFANTDPDNIVDFTLLKDTARVGGGEYNTANSSTELLTVILKIVNSIRNFNTTFSSPAVSVNAFNRTTHRSELYFSLFKPAASGEAHWDGNFKRFKLDFVDGVPEIVDQDDNGAINNATGFFKDTALSYWTDRGADAPDGDGRDTSLGGAASKLFVSNTKASSRKVYTKLGISNVLSATDNRVWEDSTILKTKLGMTNAPTAEETVYYNKLVKWLRGVDVDDEDNDGLTDGSVSGEAVDARRVMGDPLHAQPALIQYDGPDDNPDITAYVATNDGVLHALSTQTGVEQFAFIPPELLPNMDRLYQNAGGKHYGLDGTVVPYIIDNNVNGIIEPGGSENDKVYLFFGMRRGGSNYYALDVTDRSAPKLLWTIRGGVDINNDPVDTTLSAEYKHLGQTWSKPTLRIIKVKSSAGTPEDLPVLIFAAGYDTGQDSGAPRHTDNIGKGIFIVDALTGEPLWRMGPDIGADLTDAEMAYSMPSDVSAVDTNGDGYVDHLYVGDMGGQLWRVDIDNSISATKTRANIKSAITGGRIAVLAEDAAAGDAAVNSRRFYYPPSVAIGKNIDDSLYTAVVLTSGYRAHPTNRVVQDRIFMIRDTPVHGKPVDYVPIVESSTTHDLYNATANDIGQGSTAGKTAANASLASSNGWYINLTIDEAEKGLTKALIFAGELFVTTYVPVDLEDESIAASCLPKEGTGYLYHMNLFDATPVKNYDTIVSSDPDALTAEDRKVELTRAGIPADPTVITTEKGSARCVGTECSQLDGAGLHKVIYWFEK